MAGKAAEWRFSNLAGLEIGAIPHIAESATDSVTDSERPDHIGRVKEVLAFRALHISLFCRLRAWVRRPVWELVARLGTVPAPREQPLRRRHSGYSRIRLNPFSQFSRDSQNNLFFTGPWHWLPLRVKLWCFWGVSPRATTKRRFRFWLLAAQRCNLRAAFALRQRRLAFLFAIPRCGLFVRFGGWPGLPVFIHKIFIGLEVVVHCSVQGFSDLSKV